MPVCRSCFQPVQASSRECPHCGTHHPDLSEATADLVRTAVAKMTPEDVEEARQRFLAEMTPGTPEYNAVQQRKRKDAMTVLGFLAITGLVFFILANI